MIIGLVRHFPVLFKYSLLNDSVGFEKELHQYDQSPVKIIKTRNNIKWQICLSSTLRRAEETARKIFPDKINYFKELIEVPMKPAFFLKQFLPTVFWLALARILWFFNHRSQPEGKKLTQKRAIKIYKRIYDSAHDQKKILIVSHGFFLYSFQKILRQKGFKGDIFFRAKHGKIYTFKK